MTTEKPTTKQHESITAPGIDNLDNFDRKQRDSMNSRFIVRTIATGVGDLHVKVETTGYDNGDSSVTTVSLGPTDGYQHLAELSSSTGLISIEDRVATSDQAISVSFQAIGDIELDGLRQALREAAASLDELLDDPQSQDLTPARRFGDVKSQLVVPAVDKGGVVVARGMNVRPAENL